MKKKWIAIVTMTALFAAAIPVAAAAEEEPVETVEKELTDIENAGSTAVEADVIDDGSGDVSYIIAIPEKIDFGTLQMPSDDSAAHPKQVGFEVSAVEINGLDASTSRVAVLMKDASTGSSVFQIVGSSGTNNSKILQYQVLSSAGVDITSGTAYPNGYLFAAFSTAGQAISGTLSLDQNQLLADKDLTNWAGNYLGTINFYTAIASLSDY